MESTTIQTPEKQPVSQVVPKNKSTVLRAVTILAVVVLLLIVLVVGYGFYGGYAIKSYAKRAEKIFAETKKWDEGDLETSDIKEAERQIKKVESDSEKYLLELNQKKAPAKAKTLEVELKEYFTKAKKGSQNCR